MGGGVSRDPKFVLRNIWTALITWTRLLRTASSSAPTISFGERMVLATAGLKATTQRWTLSFFIPYVGTHICLLKGFHLLANVLCLSLQGAELVDNVMDVVRKEAEGCDLLQVFFAKYFWFTVEVCFPIQHVCLCFRDFNLLTPLGVALGQDWELFSYQRWQSWDFWICAFAACTGSQST